MNENISLGRIAGIHVGFNWSLLVIAALIAWSLATSFLPSTAPGHTSGAYWAAGVISALVFLASLLASGRLPRIDALGKPPWVGGSLLVLYLALYATGAILLLPLGSSISEFLVTTHLLAAVWSVPLTTVYWWRSRSDFARFFGGSLPRVPARFWLGLAIVLLPAAVLAVIPRALSPLGETGTGAIWSRVALPGIFLDRMAPSPKGEGIVAGGAGLYVGQADGRWRRLDFPAELVLGLALSTGSTQAYVGTDDGLYAAGRLDGPYRKLPLPGRAIHGIVIDPRVSSTIWASSREGFDRGWVARVEEFEA